MLCHLILHNLIFYHFNVALCDVPLLHYFDIKLFALLNITPFDVVLYEAALFNDALFDAATFHYSTILFCCSCTSTALF